MCDTLRIISFFTQVLIHISYIIYELTIIRFPTINKKCENMKRIDLDHWHALFKRYLSLTLSHNHYFLNEKASPIFTCRHLINSIFLCLSRTAVFRHVKTLGGNALSILPNLSLEKRSRANTRKRAEKFNCPTTERRKPSQSHRNQVGVLFRSLPQISNDGNNNKTA